MSEGFDEISSYDSFKGVKTATMQPTAETLTRAFREFLEEEQKETLEESRLASGWRRKAKQRAYRHKRPYNEEDRKWAHKQQSKWHKNHPELEEYYLKEIEAAREASRTTKEYLLKIKEIRRKKLEEKEKARLGHPQDKVKYNKSRKNEKPPKSNKRGIAAIKDKGEQVHVFAGESAPGVLEEIEIIPTMEEKGDGKYNRS